MHASGMELYGRAQTTDYNQVLFAIHIQKKNSVETWWLITLDKINISYNINTGKVKKVGRIQQDEQPRTPDL